MPFSIGPKIHNAIPASLKELINSFFSLRDWRGKLYLTGGTCLAEYYFGHRISVDMDIFTQDKLTFQEAARFMTDPDFFSGKTKRILNTPYIEQFLYHPDGKNIPIKVDLVLDIPIRLAPPLKVESVWIDSLEDILCNKITCLLSRNEVKDYLDLFYLIPASYLTARELADLGNKKDGGIDPVVLAYQIEFILKQPEPEDSLLGKTNWKELQLFFGKLQKELLDLVRPR